MICDRCDRPQDDCTGHFVDTPEGWRAGLTSLRRQTNGLVWSDLFPKEEES